MDTELLREQFKNAIPAAKNVLAEHQNTWGDMLPMNLGIEVEELKPLLITLESQPEFATFRGHVDGYGTPLSPRYLFPRLLRVAVDQGPDASVGWLQKVISTRRAEAKCFFLLSGLRDLECTIELLPGLRQSVINQLEETSATRMLQKTAAGGRNLFQYQLPANVALVRELIVPEFATNTNKFVLHSNLLEMESLIHLLGISTNPSGQRLGGTTTMTRICAWSGLASAIGPPQQISATPMLCRKPLGQGPIGVS